jgi:hypothetical protein
MNKNYILYDNDGRIINLVTCDESHLDMMTKTPADVNSTEFITLNAIEGHCITHLNHIVDGVVTEKLAQQISLDKLEIVADGVDKITLSGSLPGSTLFIEGGGTYLMGGLSDPDTFVTTIPGEYLFRVSLFPYLDYEVKINAI